MTISNHSLINSNLYSNNANQVATAKNGNGNLITFNRQDGVVSNPSPRALLHFEEDFEFLYDHFVKTMFRRPT